MELIPSAKNNQMGTDSSIWWATSPSFATTMKSMAPSAGTTPSFGESMDATASFAVAVTFGNAEVSTNTLGIGISGSHRSPANTDDFRRFGADKSTEVRTLKFDSRPQEPGNGEWRSLVSNALYAGIYGRLDQVGMSLADYVSQTNVVSVTKDETVVWSLRKNEGNLTLTTLDSDTPIYLNGKKLVLARHKNLKPGAHTVSAGDQKCNIPDVKVVTN